MSNEDIRRRRLQIWYFNQPKNFILNEGLHRFLFPFGVDSIYEARREICEAYRVHEDVSSYLISRGYPLLVQKIDGKNFWIQQHCLGCMRTLTIKDFESFLKPEQKEYVVLCECNHLLFVKITEYKGETLFNVVSHDRHNDHHINVSWKQGPFFKLPKKEG